MRGRGAAFVRHGRAGRARPLLNRAIRLYGRLNAARDLTRADAVLREAGMRRGRRGSRKRADRGWHSLTPTESTVAAQVAGLSNTQIGDRLYISRRTVQTHLAHVFAKLDLNTRAQRAAECRSIATVRACAGRLFLLAQALNRGPWPSARQ
jgi:DNA-binding CsgD family transcriptional regulator